MDANEASKHRKAVIKWDDDDEPVTYLGEEVYSVSDKGVVISRLATRVFFPWHRVSIVQYHNDDLSFRKFFQGF